MRISDWSSTCALPIFAQLILISFGATMLFSVAPTVIAQASPPERISEISGMLTVIRQLFLGIGAQLVTTLLAVDVVRRGGARYPSPSAYDLAGTAIVDLCLGAILLYFLARKNDGADKGVSVRVAIWWPRIIK